MSESSGKINDTRLVLHTQFSLFVEGGKFIFGRHFVELRQLALHDVCGKTAGPASLYVARRADGSVIKGADIDMTVCRYDVFFETSGKV